MSRSGVGPFLSGCWKCEKTWLCPGKMLSPVQPLDLCTLQVLKQQAVSPFLQTRTSSPKEINHLARGAPSQRPVCPEGRSDEAGGGCMAGPQSRWCDLEWLQQIFLSFSLCAVCRARWGNMGAGDRDGAPRGRSKGFTRWEGCPFAFFPRMVQQRGMLLLFLGAQLLLVGALLYQNHRCCSRAFLHFNQ